MLISFVFLVVIAYSPAIAIPVFGVPVEEKVDSVPVSSSIERVHTANLTADIDTFSFVNRYIHRIGIEGRSEYVLPSNGFLKGINPDNKNIRTSFSAHLKYAFRYHSHTMLDRIYNGSYQGVGISYYSFGEKRYLGDPIAAYLFQGARIAQFNSRLSLNYEWNFGVSFGWKPYNMITNPANHVIGSKVNAYINANVNLEWMLSQRFDLVAGLMFTHFSNGNTKLPNAGLNTTGLRMGFVYNFNRKDTPSATSIYQPVIPPFPRHISYDLVLYGSWRRAGVHFDKQLVASPDAYTVLGFNFAPMYNLTYKFRTGISLDGIYDGSANVYADDYLIAEGEPDPGPTFKKPPFRKQWALGLSARAEYVMPYFTVGLGFGANILDGGQDMSYYYQIFALKMEVTRNMFLHIGYSVKEFHAPNCLMLGFGFHFGNKRPSFH